MKKNATKRCLDVYTQTNRDATIFVNIMNGFKGKMNQHCATFDV